MDDYGYGGGSLQEDDLQGLLDAVDPAGLDYRGWVDVGMALAAEGQIRNWVKASANDWCPIVCEGGKGKQPGVLRDPEMEAAMTGW